MFRQALYHSRRTFAGRMGVALAIMVPFFVATRLFDNYTSGHTLFLLLAGTILTALASGMMAGVAAAVFSSLAQDYFYQFPANSFWVHNNHDVAQLALFLFVAVLMSWIGSSVREAHEAAKQAAREREDLLATVSHDLKNPLTAIRVNSELIAKLQPVGTPTAKAAESIHRSADRAISLISDLLDYERFRGGQPTLELGTEEPARLVEEATALIETLAVHKSIQIEKRIPGGLPPVSCDRRRVLQVFSNLLGNAVKFTPEGGHIRISCEEVADGADHFVDFSIEDDGPGISPEALPHVFDRYWQGKTSSVAQGTGLGLSIARAIVEAHGGWIQARSERGARFDFTLPLPAKSASRE